MSGAFDGVRRYQSLDVLRGIAVLGILVLNINAFALPESVYFVPVGPHSLGVTDRLVWAFDYVLFDGKMRTIFALLFGASTMLVIDRTRSAGRNAVWAHYSRMFWLLLFGMVHLLCIWWGDILVPYAICGMLLFFARNASVGSLFAAGIMLFVLAAVVFGLSGAGAVWLHYSGEGAEQLDQLNESFGYVPAQYAHEVKLHQSTYSILFADRLAAFGSTAKAMLLLLPTLLATMLIGAGLYRSGYLTGERNSAEYNRLAHGTLWLGGGGTMLLGCWMWISDFAPAISYAASFAYASAFQLMMAVGYIALICLWLEHSNGRAVQWLADAGRMAFSNYLGTSIVMTSLFYGYGLGLFGHIGRAQLWLFVLGGWAMMLLASHYWLAQHRYGPLEWLWRALARMELPAMRL